MSDVMSQNKLKNSYMRVVSDLKESIAPTFSLENYRGKHLDGKWIKYPFRCAVCGEEFERVLNNVGSISCPNCSKHKRPGRQTSWEKMLARFQEIHDNKYIYPPKPKEYSGQRTTIEIECKTHGIFRQTIRNHLGGYGCKLCSNEERRIGKDEFIKRSASIHGDRYDYTNVNYVNQYEKVKIVCSDHGEFMQAAGHHMYAGTNCPKCTVRVSRGQLEIANFIRSFGFDIIDNDRNVIAPFELDIFVPDLSLAIEYNGLRWHSELFNPNRNHQLKKHELCEKQGIRLITIFEDEWNYNNDTVKATLKHLLGKSDKGHFARKVSIKEIDYGTSKKFLENYHLLGFSNSKYRLGAFYGEELIAVMTFGTPSDERGKTNAVEMKRFVTDKRNHPGLGSKMFKWAVNKYEFDHVIAFVDRRWFTGSFKFISGFERIYSTSPTLYWTDFKNRYKRRFINKSKLKESDRFKGRDLTKKEMLAELGYYPIYDCGKIKMEWNRSG